MALFLTGTGPDTQPSPQGIPVAVRGGELREREHAVPELGGERPHQGRPKGGRTEGREGAVWMTSLCSTSKVTGKTHRCGLVGGLLMKTPLVITTHHIIQRAARVGILAVPSLTSSNIITTNAIRVSPGIQSAPEPWGGPAGANFPPAPVNRGPSRPASTLPPGRLMRGCGRGTEGPALAPSIRMESVLKLSHAMHFVRMSGRTKGLDAARGHGGTSRGVGGSCPKRRGGN